MSPCAELGPSGGMYPSVPTYDTPRLKSVTKPMSASFGIPFTKIMFAGLISRWMRP